MLTVTRELQFDAGHRIHGHESKCAFYHGHRYVAEVTVCAPEQDGLGRIVDFSVIKANVGAWIDAKWDHNMILHPDDPMLQTNLFPDKRPYVMPRWAANPTAENMAKLLFKQAEHLLGSNLVGLRISHVRLYETPNCWADWDWTKPIGEMPRQ